MLKKLICYAFVGMLVFTMSGCSTKEKEVKIGVSMGVGAAIRWDSEMQYMEERAKELGVEIETRLNRTDEPLTQEEDCKEMIDNGIDVLIFTPRDINDTKTILEYAKKNNVKVISYARAIVDEDIDLYIGYDSEKIGQLMGDYIAELAYQGDYIILKGDANDQNASLINNGAMLSIDAIKDNIHIILETDIQGWDPSIAKEKVKEAVINNGNTVDAIFAPNDKLAGASIEALAELGITKPVVVTGMDAELDAIRRIVEGTQGCTMYMDLKELASTAVNEAVHLARDEKVNVNAQYKIGGKVSVEANLIVGSLITNKNIEKQIIEKKIYTKEQVYGTGQ